MVVLIFQYSQWLADKQHFIDPNVVRADAESPSLPQLEPLLCIDDANAVFQHECRAKLGATKCLDSANPIDTALG